MPLRKFVVLAAGAVLIASSTIVASEAKSTPADAGRMEVSGVATPPMGWQSFKAFQSDIDEELIRAQADALVESGLRDAGYDILLVDGGWRAPERAANGDMQVDREKFPSGMRALGDYIHSKGLRFGLHQPMGMRDCAGATPGTQSAPGGEQQDADLFASWGVDVLKYDRCKYRYPADATAGSPDYDEIVIRRDGQVIERYEAEADANRVTGGARVDACPQCSGRQRVAGIGLRDGTLGFPEVNVPSGGEYTVEIRFVHVDHEAQLRKPKFATLSVNGGPAVSTSYPVPRKPDGDATAWGYVGSVKVDVRLREGTNTLTFANPRSYEDVTRAAYQRMADALQRTGRPIEYHICEYGFTRPWLWAPQISATWRSTMDIADAWDGFRQPDSYDGQGQRGIMNVLDKQVGLTRYVSDGSWNNPNTIEAGLGHLSTREYRTQFSLWAVLAAPLIFSGDITTMTPDTKQILTNHEVIEVDQDPDGVPGRKIRDDGHQEVWVRPLADGSTAVALLNRANLGSGTVAIEVSAQDELGLPAASSYEVRNLWSHKTRTSGDQITGHVRPHGVAMFRVRPS